MRKFLIFIIYLYTNGCGVGVLGPPSWTPKLVCDHSIGTFKFQSNIGSCDMVNWYASQLIQSMTIITNGDELPRLSDRSWEYWVWDSPSLENRDGVYGSWQVGDSNVWLERCMIGLAHETLHQWDIMKLQSSIQDSYNHKQWNVDNSKFKEVDITWQYHTQIFWCLTFRS